MAHQTEKSNRIERETRTKKIALVNEFVQSIDFTVNSHFSTFESQKNKKRGWSNPGAIFGAAVLLLLPWHFFACGCRQECFVRFTHLRRSSQYCTPNPADHVKLFYLKLLVVSQTCIEYVFVKEKDSNGIGFSPQESPVYQTYCHLVKLQLVSQSRFTFIASMGLLLYFNEMQNVM